MLRAAGRTSGDWWLGLLLVALSACTSPATNETNPVVTVGNWSYGPTDYWSPLDLQRTYVYPDGSVIEIALGGDDADDERALQLHRFEIDPDDLAELVSLAEAADLLGGDMQDLLPLPDGVQVQDGGRAVFTATIGGETTARVVDQLVSDPSYNTEGERAAFAQLHAAVTALTDGPERSEMAFDRWVVVSAPLDQDEPDDDPSVWTGPDLDTIDWTTIDGGAQCAIVERSDWPLTRAEREDWQLVIGQRHITRRPLLPHESTCADVEAWRSVLGL